MDVERIAKQLFEEKDSIILIYAFNATGKTRLSVAYKDYSKGQNNGMHAGVYYNAFSEDLFQWDNDEENNNENLRLRINSSSLSQYHSLLTEDSLLQELEPYNPQYTFAFNHYDDLEKGIESVSFFSVNKKDVPIKISRGEERVFVWCFFLALFEIDDWSEEQSAHFFIDDPVSSMDENNIYITTDSIFDLIKENYLKRKFIITTHHIGLFSILADRLKRGEESSSFKDLTKLYVLHKDETGLKLVSSNHDVFLFHLHLMQTLDKAIKTELFAYHFVLLRQLIETISSFLGSGGISYCLHQIGIEDTEETGNTINSLSHKNSYRLQSNKMSENEETIFKNLFNKIQTKYNFKF